MLQGALSQLPAIPVKAVGSVGAGDTFIGALTASLALRDKPAQAMIRASAAGAMTVTKFGAQGSMPTKSAVGRLLLERSL